MDYQLKGNHDIRIRYKRIVDKQSLYICTVCTLIKELYKQLYMYVYPHIAIQGQFGVTRSTRIQLI